MNSSRKIKGIKLSGSGDHKFLTVFCVLISLQLSGSQQGLKERDELVVTVASLKNNLNDLKSKADMCDYYK